MAWEKDENTILSDLDLVKRSISGDNKSQELLYKRFFSYAMSICIRYTKSNNEAIEVVNDSFMKVLESLAHFDNAKPFKSWYARILVNTAIDSYRKNLKHNSTLSISSIPDTEEQEPGIDMELSAEDILKLFDQLPENYRITFNLYEIEGFSHNEIGQLLGVTTSTSRSNLARAKKMLRTLYNQQNNPEKKRHEAV
jgi:RNA polymerase sigma-70 factor (ECF subfamily)